MYFLFIFLQIEQYLDNISNFAFLENVSKEGEDVISAEKMKEILINKQLESLLDSKLLTAATNNQSYIWCEEKQLDGLDIPNGSSVRLRTKGNGPYLGTLFLLVSFSSFPQPQVDMNDFSSLTIDNFLQY